jgi:hypothetical protein
MRPRMEFGAAKTKMADYADANRALRIAEDSARRADSNPPSARDEDAAANRIWRRETKMADYADANRALRV